MARTTGRRWRPPLGTSTFPAWALALALLASCGGQRTPGAAVASTGASAARSLTQILHDVACDSASEPSAEDLAFEPNVIPLRVRGHRDAVLALPDGWSEGQGARPVMVAVHGNYDRVETFCEAWSRIVRGTGFVLCPRGIPRKDAGLAADRWTFGWNGRDLEREIDAGLEALRGRYGEAANEREVVYAGFSLGAILGADIVLWKPSRYTRAVLVEGGTANWSLDTAKRFRKGGGRKLLFACGQEMCVRDTRPGMYWAEVVGLEARTAFAGTIGHTYQGIVADEISRQWSWLTDADPRWQSPSEREIERPVAARDRSDDKAQPASDRNPM